MRMGDYFNNSNVPLAFRPEVVMRTKRTQDLLKTKNTGKLNSDIFDVSETCQVTIEKPEEQAEPAKYEQAAASKVYNKDKHLLATEGLINADVVMKYVEKACADPVEVIPE